MIIYGLPGRKEDTEAWMEQLFCALSMVCIQVAHYRHWDEPLSANPEFEALRLKGLQVDLLIAKSFGTVVASLAFSLYLFRPAAAVFIGTPLKQLTSMVMESIAQFAQQTPTLFIQQSDDIKGTYAQVTNTVLKFKRAETAEVPGDDHLYDNIPELVSIIKPWMESSVSDTR